MRGLIVGVLGCVACGGEEPVVVVSEETCESREEVDGAELFARTWVPMDPRSPSGDGLGPVFNDVSCAACHALGGPGGAGSNDKNVVIRIDAKGRSQVEHRTVEDERRRVFAMGRSIRQKVLSTSDFGFDVVRVQRSTPALFGAGLIDAIPEGVLWTQAALGTGRVAEDVNGRAGRFGWKGHIARLDTFVEAACANEMGLETSTELQPGPVAPGVDMDDAMLDALTDHVARLPRPQRLPVPGADAGEAVFAQIGCDGCHTPTLGEVAGLYSDLLLHDMGRDLAEEGVSYVTGVTAAAAPHPGAARAEEWRTPPLWGLRDSAPYLHDGRARTIEDAVRMHGGEALPTRRAWEALESADREALRAFLNSLVAPTLGA